MLLSLQKPLEIIATVCQGRGIGYNGPWGYIFDMKHFNELTTHGSNLNTETRNAVIMGKNTWQSLSQPLPNRLNVVITRDYARLRDVNIHNNVLAFPSLLEATLVLSERGDIIKQFVIGGTQLYQEALQCNWSSYLHLSTIHEDHECDTFFPEIPHYYIKESLCDLRGVAVTTYRNKYGRHYEEQYLYKMRELIHRVPVVGRNGYVHTNFQWQFTMNLADGLPLFSTRKGYWKGICKELLFFIHGKTNSKILENDGIRIWQGNTTREFLDSRALPYMEGDMGPMYGWVWRNYGARYQGMDHDYSAEGYDQLYDVIHKLRTDPTNRRILMTSFDPSKISESVLAPCHSIVNQFYVREVDGVKYLDMYTYQRSADMFLGVYFNIPSDATLQTIVALAVNMTPGMMYVQFGNYHLYATHRGALKEQLLRTPEDMLPSLSILPPTSNSTQESIAWIESLTYEDFKVDNYKGQCHIKADMVV